MKAVTDTKYYDEIAEKLRTYGASCPTHTPADMADAVEEVANFQHSDGYESGFMEGYTDGEEFGWGSGYDVGYDDGYESGESIGRQEAYDNGYADGSVEGEATGRQVQYDEFWDAYQDNGNRTDYGGAFYGGGWTAENLKPKYDMHPTNAKNMFYYANFNVTGVENYMDLKATLESLNVTLDFKNATNFANCFQNAKIRNIGVIDLGSATGTSSLSAFLCNTYGLNSVEKIIVNENNVFSSTSFSNCYAKSIIFEGVIACDLSLPHASLNYESLISIIDTLKDYSGTDTVKTLTLSAASHTVLEEAEEGLAKIAEANGKGWTIA